MERLAKLTGELLRRGRETVGDPEVGTTHGLHSATNMSAVHAKTQLLIDMAEATRGLELCELVSRGAAGLVAYQDENYAHAYLSFLSKVRTAEMLACEGSTALSEAVARNLYRLMTYRDEYEMARLILDEAPRSSTMGKLRPGATRSMLRVLKASRRLRGAQYDLFGYAPIRRRERELVVLYRRQVEKLIQGLSLERLEAAVEVATLPDPRCSGGGLNVSDVDRHQALDQIREHLIGERVIAEGVTRRVDASWAPARFAAPRTALRKGPAHEA